MKKIAVLGIAVIALAVALPAMADVQDYGELYYAISPPPNVGNAWDPTGAPNETWPALYNGTPRPIQMPVQYGNGWIATGGTIEALAGKTLKKDSILLIGFENSRVEQNEKYLTLRIKLTDPSKTLDTNSFKAGKEGAISNCKVVLTGIFNGEYMVVIKIVPQPDWEWIAIKNTSGADVQIERVGIRARCSKRIPSLTGWGIGILILLLAATAVWIVRNKKTVVPA